MTFLFDTIRSRLCKNCFPNPKPRFSSRMKESIFLYNYNPAAFTLNGSTALLIRCQNETGGVSVLGFSYRLVDPSNSWREMNMDGTLSRVSSESVVLAPESPIDENGIEDPRVLFNPLVFSLVFV
jgi:predicted GH43/DUF377 family glycosyl hydrolase